MTKGASPSDSEGSDSIESPSSAACAPTNVKAIAMKAFSDMIRTSERVEATHLLVVDANAKVENTTAFYNLKSQEEATSRDEIKDPKEEFMASDRMECAVKKRRLNAISDFNVAQEQWESARFETSAAFEEMEAAKVTQKIAITNLQDATEAHGVASTDEWIATRAAEKAGALDRESEKEKLVESFESGQTASLPQTISPETVAAGVEPGKESMGADLRHVLEK